MNLLKTSAFSFGMIDGICERFSKTDPRPGFVWRCVFFNVFISFLLGLTALKAQDKAVNTTPNIKYSKARLSPSVKVVRRRGPMLWNMSFFLITVVVNKGFSIHLQTCLCFSLFSQVLSALHPVGCFICVYTPSKSEQNGQRPIVHSFIHFYWSFCLT